MLGKKRHKTFSLESTVHAYLRENLIGGATEKKKSSNLLSEAKNTIFCLLKRVEEWSLELLQAAHVCTNHLGGRALQCEKHVEIFYASMKQDAHVTVYLTACMTGLVWSSYLLVKCETCLMENGSELFEIVKRVAQVRKEWKKSKKRNEHEKKKSSDSVISCQCWDSNHSPLDYESNALAAAPRRLQANFY